MRFDASQGSCHVYTFKEGLLSTFGHDLELAVTRFTVELAEGERAVEARFDAGSLKVVRALSGGREVGPLSARDRASIEAAIADDVLRARRFPEIVFRSTEVAPPALRGTLALLGQTRAIACTVERGGGRSTAEARLHQPDFGIQPYAAMLGALKVRPDVIVRVTLPV